MNLGPQLLLVGAVAAVGVLHTIVPDHWVPITLIARQRGWSKGETARASFQAAVGHVLSTLLIGAVVWLAGVAVAERFGRAVDAAASLALVAFGGWIALGAWRELHRGSHGDHHGHGHVDHRALFAGDVHGAERKRMATAHGELTLSIYESGGPPRFRATGPVGDALKVETRRGDGRRQIFLFANHGSHWESTEEISEPHRFDVSITVGHGADARTFETRFVEHDHSHDTDHDHRDGHGDEAEAAHDPLYLPLPGEAAILTRHTHFHRHGRGPAHAHWHDHRAENAHPVMPPFAVEPPVHDHRHKTSGRVALLLILGSSPMVEGIPAFFAAGKFGIGVIVVMAVVFALSTIATYVLLSVYSTAGLQRVRLGALERYGEVLSGAFMALVGVAFWAWPVL
jgi:hypothetical protein